MNKVSSQEIPRHYVGVFFCVKRNARRFPKDFMFKLTRDEVDSLVKCQIVTSRVSDFGIIENSEPSRGKIKITHIGAA